MKIRRDFVTNSSSSSYVISYNSIPEFDSETISKYPCVQALKPLIEAIIYCEDDYDTEAGEVYTSIEELDKWLLDSYGWKTDMSIEELLEDDYSQKEYESYKREIEAGNSIIVKNVAYCAESLVSLLHLLEKSEAGIKILSDGC